MTHPAKPLACGGRILTGAAAAVALYLAVMALGHTELPGCESGSACQNALASPWASVFGLPVSFIGFVLYSGMLWMSSDFLRRQGNLAEATGSAAAVLIPLTSLWFTGVQALLLQQFCLWCCVAHGLATAGVALLWLARRKSQPSSGTSTPGSRKTLRALTTAAVLGGAAILVTGALSGVKPAAAPETPPPPAIAAVPTSATDSASAIDPAAFPLMGRSDAPSTSLLLTDFTSPPSRALHAALDALAQRRGAEFRVIVLPAAPTPAAAAIHRTLLALWHVDPAKWHAAAALISSKQIEATPEAVEKAAIQLAGADRFTTAVRESAARIEAQMNAAREFQTRSPGSEPGHDTLPRLIHGSRVLSAAETDPAQLTAFLTGGAPATPAPAKPAAAPATAQEAGPRIAILNPEVDLKTMSPGKPVDVEIKVQNRGNRPLQLGWLETDKGCFVTSLPAENIRPGETAAIGLKVHPPPKPGIAHQRSIRVHSNSPGKPSEIVLHSTLAAPTPTPAPLSPAQRTASVPRPATTQAKTAIP